MVGQLGGDLRGYSFLAGMDGTDGVKEFSMYMPLQYVSPRTSFKSAQHLDVACVRRQDNDAGIGEFGSNTDDCLDAVQGRHLEIHQRYIRPVQSELVDSFLPVRGFRHQLHIGFTVDECCDPLAEDSMVVDGEDPNGVRIDAHEFPDFLRNSLNPGPLPDV